MSGIKSFKETTLLKFQALILACEKPYQIQNILNGIFTNTYTTNRERERERERDMHFLVSKSFGQLDRRMRWIRKIEKEKKIERKCKKILKIHENIQQYEREKDFL